MQTIKNLLTLVLEKPTAALRVISTDENSALEEPFRSLSPDVGVSLENSASKNVGNRADSDGRCGGDDADGAAGAGLPSSPFPLLFCPWDGPWTLNLSLPPWDSHQDEKLSRLPPPVKRQTKIPNYERNV